MRFTGLMVTGVAAAFCALVSCSTQTHAGASVDKQLRGYVPANAKFLAEVDWDRIKRTDFYKRHESQLNFSQMDQATADVGINPQRDLTSVLMAWNGDDLLFLTHGNYSSDQLQKKLGSSAQTERFGRYTLYGDGKRDVVFLPKGVALFGAPLIIKAAVHSSEAGSGNFPEDLDSELARIDKTAQVWEASTGPIPLSQMALRSDTSSILSNIADYVNGTDTSITFGGGIKLDSHISCVSDEGSKRVHDALRGAIGFARLSTRDNQLDQLKIWDAIKVDQQGKEVHVSADFPAEIADKVLALLPLNGRRS